MISRTTLIKCTYCEQIRQNQYLEPVTHISRDKCTQEFIVTTQKAYNGVLLKPTDLVCIKHEGDFRLKYTSYKRGGTYSTEYKQKYKERNALLNPSQCSCCTQVAATLHRVSSFKNESFISFVLVEGIQRITRATSTGISQDDEICHKCYLILRKKWLNPHYTPKKKPTISHQLGGEKRKSERKISLLSKKLCTEESSSTATLTSHPPLTPRAAPQQTPPRFRTPTPTGSIGASTQYMREMEIDIPEFQQPAFPFLTSPIRLRRLSQPNFPSPFTSPHSSPGLLSPSSSASSPGLLSPNSSAASDSSEFSDISSTLSPNPNQSDETSTIKSPGTRDSGSKNCAKCSKIEDTSLVEKHKERYLRLTASIKEKLQVYARSKNVVVNLDADFVHKKCLKDIKDSSDKAKICFICKRELKKAPNRKKSGASAKTTNFPLDYLQYITNNEQEQITVNSKVHEVCLDLWKTENLQKSIQEQLTTAGKSLYS